MQTVPMYICIEVIFTILLRCAFYIGTLFGSNLPIVISWCMPDYFVIYLES